MVVTGFTTYDSIRAVLGLSDKELPNATLCDEIYAAQLAVDMAAVSEDLEADYTTAFNLTTLAAVNFVSATRAFAAHAVAYRCITALWSLAPKSLTDGKAGFIRASDSIEALGKRVESAFLLSRASLKRAYATYKGAGAPVPVVMVVGDGGAGSYDPVTGV